MRHSGLFLTGLGIVLCGWIAIASGEEKPVKKAAPPAAVQAPLLTGKTALRQALDKKITIDAKETPLVDVMDLIGQPLHLRINLDKKALDDVGVDPDAPVTYSGADVTARPALDFILRSLDLTWVVRDEWVLVTTPERADTMMELVIYDVTDLVLFQDEKGGWFEKCDALVEAITSCIQPTSWDTVGGPGDITPVSLPMSTVLAVSQTDRVHEQVEHFLAELRKADAARRKQRSIPEPTVEQMLRRKTAVAAEGMLELRPAIENKVAPDPSREILVQGVNGFAWRLYQRVATESRGNVLCSPVSVATLLGMLQAGARHETGAELARALGLLHAVDGEQRRTLIEESIQPAFSSLLGTLRAQRSINGYDLVVANRLWGQTAAKYQPDYLDLLSKHYKADVVRVDFGRPDDVAQQINDWTDRATSGFLRGRIDPRLFHAETNMVLTNAVYFRGFWAEPFESMATQQKLFFGDDRTLEVPMMRQTKQMNYAEVDDLQILEKRYLGDAVSMMFILPRKEPGALAALESRLSPALFGKWSKALQPLEVEAHLPRFTFDTEYHLQEHLKALGVKTAFQRGQADFSGINGNRELFVQFVRHQARIEVDEQGTRAAARTAGVGYFGGPPKPNVFVADHPFLFVIRDTRTGAILFLGRVAMPEQDRFHN